MLEGDTEQMINHEWPHGVKYSSSKIFQNYLVFIKKKKYIKWHILVELLGLISGNLMEYQKKISKI